MADPSDTGDAALVPVDPLLQATTFDSSFVIIDDQVSGELLNHQIASPPTAANTGAGSHSFPPTNQPLVCNYPNPETGVICTAEYRRECDLT